MERDVEVFFEIEGQSKIEDVIRIVSTGDFDNIVHGRSDGIVVCHHGRSPK